MKPTSRARAVTIGLTCLALASGCSSPSTPVAQPPVGCRPVDSLITAPPASTSALGSEHAIPTRAGQISASVTKIVDPAPGGPASPGCRIVEIDLRLRSGATTADTVDLFNLALVVGASGHAYTQYPGTEPRIGGRNGLDLTGLVGNTERRGPMHFQLPVDDQPRYFLVKDSSLAIDLTGPVAAVPVEAYRPGRWPKLGTRQVVKRLPGEQIDVTPLRVMDPVATTDGVGPRSRAVAVQLRIKVTGTKPWSLNPENLVGMMDDSGQKWLPGFVTTSAVPQFDPFHTAPGQQTVAWVVAEVPLTSSRPVALMLSSYPGQVWAWRL